LTLENKKKKIFELNSNNKEELIKVKNLKTQFFTEEGIVKAVDGVSFNILKDEVLGLVGETGCGKSVTALSIIGLVREPGKIVDGEIIFNDINLLDLSENEMRNIRGKEITMIFQDPLNSLNPVMKIGTQIEEVLLLHQKEELNLILDEKRVEYENNLKRLKELEKSFKNEKEKLNENEIKRYQKEIKDLKQKTRYQPIFNNIIEEKAIKIIKEVGIPDAKGILDRYPHELSGGMRQRIMIAMGLSCNPKLLIADEPTTALDVTIQAQILDLMKNLKEKFKTSILMITHDLGIIAEICDRIAVMYSGNIVEYATAENLFKNPRHPYTKGLISAIPTLEKKNKKLQTIRGTVPNLIYPPSGCRFHPRCDKRLEICDKVRPRFTEIGDRYYVACHLYDPKYKDSPKYDWSKKEIELSKKI